MAKTAGELAADINAWKNQAGQNIGKWIAGAGGIVSNVYGADVRLGGGQGLGARIAGESKPYYSTTQNIQYSKAGINPYSNYPAGYKGPGGETTTTTQEGGGNPNPAIKTDTNGNPNPGNGGGGGGGVDENAALQALLREIDDTSNQGYNLLDEQETRLRSEYPTDEANLIGKVDLRKTEATNEQNQLLQDVTDQEKLELGKVDNALQQAIRAKNALTQQIMARYGMGSSTGGAVTDLASQEFYRQQGGLNQEIAKIGDTVIKEFGKIKLFTKGKIDELEQYKNEAVAALKKDLGDRLNTIATARVGIGQNKAQLRLAAIQDTINSAREVANQAKTFRQTLAMNAVDNMQKTAGRAFTPAEIKAVLNDFGAGGFGSIGANPNATINPAFYGKTNREEDELKGLMG